MRIGCRWGPQSDRDVPIQARQWPGEVNVVTIRRADVMVVDSGHAVRWTDRA